MIKRENPVNKGNNKRILNDDNSVSERWRGDIGPDGYVPYNSTFDIHAEMGILRLSAEERVKYAPPPRNQKAANNMHLLKMVPPAWDASGPLPGRQADEDAGMHKVFDGTKESRQSRGESPCRNDHSVYGAAHCDQAAGYWGYSCSEMEYYFNWDCLECACPLDGGAGIGYECGSTSDPNLGMGALYVNISSGPTIMDCFNASAFCCKAGQICAYPSMNYYSISMGFMSCLRKRYDCWGNQDPCYSGQGIDDEYCWGNNDLFDGWDNVICCNGSTDWCCGNPQECRRIVNLNFEDVPEVIYGCTDPNSCLGNYNPDATVDDGSCRGWDCNQVCDGGGVMLACGCNDDSSCLGCTDSVACNFNPDAEIDDETCTYPSSDLCLCGDIPIEVGHCDCVGNYYDCGGICNGPSIEDECDVCNGPGPEAGFDCAGICTTGSICLGGFGSTECLVSDCGTNSETCSTPPWYDPTQYNNSVCNKYRFRMVQCCGPMGINLLGDMRSEAPPYVCDAHWIGAFHPKTGEIIGETRIGIGNGAHCGEDTEGTYCDVFIYQGKTMVGIYGNENNCDLMEGTVPLFKLWYGGSSLGVGIGRAEYAMYPCICQGEVMGCDAGACNGPCTGCKTWAELITDDLSYQEDGYNNGAYCCDMIPSSDCPDGTDATRPDCNGHCDQLGQYWEWYPEGNAITPMSGNGSIVWATSGHHGGPGGEVPTSSFPAGGLQVFHNPNPTWNPGCIMPAALGEEAPATRTERRGFVWWQPCISNSDCASGACSSNGNYGGFCTVDQGIYNSCHGDGNYSNHCGTGIDYTMTADPCCLDYTGDNLMHTGCQKCCDVGGGKYLCTPDITNYCSSLGGTPVSDTYCNSYLNQPMCNCHFQYTCPTGAGENSNLYECTGAITTSPCDFGAYTFNIASNTDPWLHNTQINSLAPCVIKGTGIGPMWGSTTADVITMPHGEGTEQGGAQQFSGYCADRGWIAPQMCTPGWDTYLASEFSVPDGLTIDHNFSTSCWGRDCTQFGFPSGPGPWTEIIPGSNVDPTTGHCMTNIEDYSECPIGNPNADWTNCNQLCEGHYYFDPDEIDFTTSPGDSGEPSTEFQCLQPSIMQFLGYNDWTPESDIPHICRWDFWPTGIDDGSGGIQPGPGYTDPRPPHYDPTCRTDRDCDIGQICVAGICRSSAGLPLSGVDFGWPDPEDRLELISKDAFKNVYKGVNGRGMISWRGKPPGGFPMNINGKRYKLNNLKKNVKKGKI